MFKINDNVKINNTNLTGKIIRIKKSNNTVLYTVSINNSNVVVKEDKLSYYAQPKNLSNKNNISITYSIDNSNYTNEIMLRHQTVEIALENLERFISQAICNKEKRIRIIHGRHGGILRNAVHEYLDKSPYIDRYELADYYEGSIRCYYCIFKIKRQYRGNKAVSSKKEFTAFLYQNYLIFFIIFIEYYHDFTLIFRYDYLKHCYQS